MEFDIWSDVDGKLTAQVAKKEYVYDSDAPYGYSNHEVRVTAFNRREALSKFRKMR